MEFEKFFSVLAKAAATKKKKKILVYIKKTLCDIYLRIIFPLFVSALRFLHVCGCFSVWCRRKGQVSAASHERKRHSLYWLQLSRQQPRRLHPRSPEHPGEGNEHHPGTWNGPICLDRGCQTQLHKETRTQNLLQAKGQFLSVFLEKWYVSYTSDLFQTIFCVAYKNIHNLSYKEKYIAFKSICLVCVIH